MTDESGDVYAPLQGRSGRPRRRASPAAQMQTFESFPKTPRNHVTSNVHGLFYVRNMFF
jgi:hypothetical protein